MFADGDFLNGQYTVWGKVDEQGMACVDKIAQAASRRPTPTR